MSTKSFSGNMIDNPYALERESEITGMDKGFDVDNTGYIESLVWQVNRQVTSRINRRAISYHLTESGFTPNEITAIGVIAFVVKDESDLRDYWLFVTDEIVRTAQFDIGIVKDAIAMLKPNSRFGMLGVIVDVEWNGIIVSVSVLHLPRGKSGDVNSDGSVNTRIRPNKPKAYKRNRRQLQ